jgi:hypothetical protein
VTGVFGLKKLRVEPHTIAEVSLQRNANHIFFCVFGLNKLRVHIMLMSLFAKHERLAVDVRTKTQVLQRLDRVHLHTGQWKGTTVD